MTRFMRLKSARVFFLIVVLGNIGLLTWWWLSAYEISNESGPIENIQAVILFLVFAIYCFNGLKQEGASQTVAIVFCFFCFYLFFREVDFETFTASELVLSITRGRTKKLIFCFSLLLLSGFIVSRFAHFWTIVAAMLHRRAWPYYLWLVLMIFGQLAEEVSRVYGNSFGNFAIPHGQFLEEMLELNAYIALLFASIDFYEFSRFIRERAGYRAEKTPNNRTIFNRSEPPASPFPQKVECPPPTRS